MTNGHPVNHSNANGTNGHAGPATPCTPGDPLTHYHHRNEDHYTAAFACMNRMRIHSQVSIHFNHFQNTYLCLSSEVFYATKAINKFRKRNFNQF